MPVPVLAVLGAVVVVIALIVGLAVLERRRLAARDVELARDAAQRGWHFTSTTARGTRTERWQGMGFAGPWTAEIVEHRGRKRPTLRISRWWNGAADAVPPTGAPILLLISLGDDIGRPLAAATDGGLLAQMMAGAVRMGLAFAVDHRFGPQGSVQGRELHRVDQARPIVDGFAVLSDQPAEATRRLTPGLVAAIRQAFPPGAWDDGPIPHPWISLAGDRVVIAAMSRLAPRASDVAALVQAGVLVAQHRP